MKPEQQKNLPLALNEQKNKQFEDDDQNILHLYCVMLQYVILALFYVILIYNMHTYGKKLTIHSK